MIEPFGMVVVFFIVFVISIAVPGGHKLCRYSCEDLVITVSAAINGGVGIVIGNKKPPIITDPKMRAYGLTEQNRYIRFGDINVGESVGNVGFQIAVLIGNLLIFHIVIHNALLVVIDGVILSQIIKGHTTAKGAQYQRHYSKHCYKTKFLFHGQPSYSRLSFLRITLWQIQ